VEGVPIVNRSESDTEAVRAFVRGLSNEERTLLVIRDELYSGSWDEMMKDLTARLHAKPYVFKLASRIEDDIVRIRKMQEFENEHHLNLKDYV